jgi:hypothetical protein
MIIAIDFDGTIVREDRRYDDVYSPLVLMPSVRPGLESLRRAGHLLVLWSARMNRARMYLPEFDPLVRAGHVAPHSSSELHAARWRQMLRFVAAELPGIFHAIDDGRQGKVCADLYIDNMSIRLGGPEGWSWDDVRRVYGE